MCASKFFGKTLDSPQTASWVSLLSKDCLAKLNDIPKQALT